MPETSNTSSLESEIQALQQKLEEKKRELQAGAENMPHEKEIFREVLREHVEDTRYKMQDTDDMAKVSIPVSPSITTDQQTTDAVEHAEEIEALVHIAFSEGILKAVQAARETRNPHIVDELHDRLVDEYYDKLLAARQITS